MDAACATGLPDLLRSTRDFIYSGKSDVRPAHTFESPHRCVHCQSIIVDCSVLDEKWEDRWIGQGLGADPASLVLLGYDLERACDAAIQGCALYAWVLENLFEDTTNETSFLERIISEHNHLSLHFTGSRTITVWLEWGKNRTKELAHRHISRIPLLSCAAELNPCAKVISKRPPRENIFSPRSIEFSKHCLSVCLEHHEMCRDDWIREDAAGRHFHRNYTSNEQIPNETIPVQDLPTRLLKIEGTDNLIVHLVDLETLSMDERLQIASDGYATLSYCWGPEGNPLQLKSENQRLLQRGIRASLLPATVEQSIIFVHSLRLGYIWVDALCIVQDSTQDKEIEISRMGSYYGSNTLTICAASASGSGIGLSPTESRNVYTHGPIELSCNIKGVRGHVMVHSELDVREPLVNRGWTLQESLLSRRILIFSNQIYWCCSTANASCEGEFPVLPNDTNRNMGWPHSFVPQIFPLSVLRSYSPELQWKIGLENFTERILGFESDKLLAISAFAQRIHLAFQGRGSPSLGLPDGTGARQFLQSGLEYVGGLFLSQENTYLVAFQLLWVPRQTSLMKRATSYRAPTWSWACLDGPILMDAGGECSAISLNKWVLSLNNESAPFGGITHASLHLQCRLRELPLGPEYPLKIAPITNAHMEDGLLIVFDTDDEHDCDSSATGTNYLMQITQAYNVNKFWHLRGLVVYKSSDSPHSVYTRVGTFSLLRSGVKEDDGGKRLSSVFDMEQDVILL